MWKVYIQPLYLQPKLKTMKLLLLFVLLSSFIYAQKPIKYPVTYYDRARGKVVQETVDLTALGVSTVYDDAKQLLKTVDERADSLIRKVAPKLGVAADKVWDTLVRQQRVNAYMYTFIFIVYIFTWYVFVLRLKAGEENSWNAAKDIILSLMSGGLVIIGTITMIASWSVIWTGWFNPEYGAMIQLAEFAKSI